MAQSFAKIAKLETDLPLLLLRLRETPHLWTENTDRQKYPGSAHHSTETIYLRWAKTQTIEAAFEELEAVDYPALSLFPEVGGIINLAAHLVGATKFGRAVIVKLPAGKMIDQHVDEGVYADHYERFHIPLQAEKGSHFFCEVEPQLGEYAYMQPGELWWFNHKKPHSFYNFSDADRIHLIMDMVAPRYRRERV